MTLSPRGVVEAPAREWRRYPEYKNSGVEWLGEMPAHWRVQRLTYMLSRNDSGVWGDDAEEKDDGVVVLRSTDMTVDGGWSVKDPARRSLTQLEYRSARLQAGDLVVTKSSGSALHLGKTAFVTPNIEALDCCFSNFMQRLRTGKGADPRYLYWLLNCPVGRQQLNYLGSTTTGLANLNGTVIGRVYSPCPELEEQRFIAAFLDRETQKIDDLIAKRERLIGLLEEKRTALISRAVTKGLDPDVPTKDSGVEWLGEIPEHWEMKRLKFLAKVRTGVAKGRNLGEQVTADLPYLRVANVQDGYLDLSDVATITVGIDEVESYSLKAGDVLMNEGGDFDKLGRGTVWQGQIDPCLHQNHVFAVRPGAGAGPEWLSTITLTIYAKHYFILRSKQSTNLASISSFNLQNLPIVLPPPEERSRILTFVDRETAKIDALVGKVREHIEKLREYRTALISAVVTGKIDVREEVSEVPDPKGER